jgi:hypothetical protein
VQARFRKIRLTFLLRQASAEGPAGESRRRGKARKIPRPGQKGAKLKPAPGGADTWSVTLTITPRARVLLIVALVLAVAGAGLTAYTRVHKSNDSTVSSSASPTKHHRASPKPVATPNRAVHPKLKPKATPKPKPAAVAPSDQLPAAIRRALANQNVVVVALYDPKVKIDGTALREAKAGAQLAGSSFVPINVRTNGIDALNARYGVIQDPALLVLRPPGDLVVRIDGFADRDTVAQAAVDAAS